MKAGQGPVTHGQIFNSINVNAKGVYQMQLELRNAMEAVILLYDVWNMLKCAFELQSLSHPVSLTRWYTQERDVV